MSALAVLFGAGAGLGVLLVVLGLRVTTALVVFLAVFNHGYLAPYGSPLGQVVLALVGCLFAGAFAWMARLTRSVPAARLLAAGEEATR